MIGVAGNSDGYSRAVNWLKVALPLVGLVMLSTLFLVARETRLAQREMPSEAFSPDGTVETVTKPDYSGLTRDGSQVTVIAEKAWPKAQTSDQFEGVQVRARFDMPDGERAEVRAETGTLMPGEDLLELRGDVVMTTQSGWTVESEMIDAQLDWTRLTSPTDVKITEGPIGTLDAGHMVVTRDTAAGADYLMEFDGGVHLVYHP